MSDLRYCAYCCRRQPTHGGCCALCGRACEPDSDHCPRDASGRGQHNAFKQANGTYACSRCNQAMPRPVDADVYVLGPINPRR
jgi:hypothetical protein